VGDSVTAVARVVRAVQATPDFRGELSLLIGITGARVARHLNQQSRGT
jgi:hypothetical protein